MAAERALDLVEERVSVRERDSNILFFLSTEKEIVLCASATRDMYVSNAKMEEKKCQTQRKRERCAMNAIMLHYDCNCIVEEQRR